jgi:hypothetical protein
VPISTEGGVPGDAVTLTSPTGFTVDWIAPLSGIGGGCDSKAPHWFIDRILTMPATGSLHRLYIDLAIVQGNRTLAVVDATSVSPGLKIGDTGSCLYYPTFHSKTHTDLYLTQFRAHAPFVGSGAQMHDSMRSLTDSQYIHAPDVRTSLMIFRSLRY